MVLFHAYFQVNLKLMLSDERLKFTFLPFPAGIILHFTRLRKYDQKKT